MLSSSNAQFTVDKDALVPGYMTDATGKKTGMRATSLNAGDLHKLESVAGAPAA
jgi:hypothetical protein